MSDNPLDLMPVDNPLALADRNSIEVSTEALVHNYGKHHQRCDTDARGYPTPNNSGDPNELVLDTHLGFIPLWEKDVTLRWRFNEYSISRYTNPEAAKQFVRKLLGQGLALWGPAVPLKFTEQRDLYDFEVVLVAQPDCENGSCVLASAFFPDGGRHQLKLYPTLFELNAAEQAETLAHEFGHVFGLRHWFAKVNESAWSSVDFGSTSPFSIMNYGEKSQMTDADKVDLSTLYQAVWSGRLTQINNTPIRLFKPYSSNL